nr:WG repeat-containing protein [Paenibacillus turpanensis]
MPCNLRFISILLGFLLCFLPVTGNAASTEPTRVYIDGVEVYFTQPPVVEKATTLVQLRPVYERLGIEMKWDGKTQTITSSKDQTIIVMQINSKEVTINGEPSTITIAPRIIDQSTFVPLRFIAESIGGEVLWDETGSRVDIISKHGRNVFLAALQNDLQQAEHWLEKGDLANYFSPTDKLTSLGAAIHHENIKIAEILLSFGADANAGVHGPSPYASPLESAIQKKNPEFVRLLLDYGADPSNSGKEGTALDAAKSILLAETNSAHKEKLEQIIDILQHKIQQDALILSEDKPLIPFNGGNPFRPYMGEWGSWGFLDDTGAVAIKPRFSFIAPFSEGLAFAVSKDRLQSGYIDKTGKFRFTFEFEPDLSSGEFKEGLAPVGKDDRWGYIDTSGQFIIEPQYDYAQLFSEGLASVEVNGKWGLIDKSGEIILEPKYDWIFPFRDGRALVHGERPGFIDTKGDLTIDFEALGILEYGQFSEKLASVRKDEKVGFINNEGQFVIPPTYKLTYNFSEGFATVFIDGKCGYIDSSGQLVIPAVYDSAYPFRNGQALVKRDGLLGFINTKGEVILPFTYTRVKGISTLHEFGPSMYRPFSDEADGMAILYKDDQVYYVFPDGKIVEPIKK